jgi:hypothetical protein
MNNNFLSPATNAILLGLMEDLLKSFREIGASLARGAGAGINTNIKVAEVLLIIDHCLGKRGIYRNGQRIGK